MINLHPTDAVWLISGEEVVSSFTRAVETVRQVYRKQYGAQPRGTVGEKLEGAFDYGIAFENWGVEDIQALLESTFRGLDHKVLELRPEWRHVPKAYEKCVSQFFRVVFVTLWGWKVFLAPLEFQTVVNLSEVFDSVCEKLDVECLSIIRGAHPESKIDSIFKREEFACGSSRVNFWLRLLLSTTAYTMEDLSEQDATTLFQCANGEGELPLRRYYVNDFLLVLTAQNASKRKIVESLINEHKAARDSLKAAKVSKGRSVGRKRPKNRTPADEAYDTSFLVAKEIASGLRDFKFEEVFKEYLPGHRLGKIFTIGEESNPSPFFKLSHLNAQNFSVMLDGFFRSFTKSKRLQSSKGYDFAGVLLMSYSMCYLPSFFLKRDGNLHDYPKNLNDFNCTLFFTREATFLDGVIKFEKQPPRTFLGYMKEFARASRWTNDTHYGRVLIIEQFCDYVQEHNLILPDCGKFKSNFTVDCYPPVEKKAGTVKVPVPRPYFSAFISMLDSLEYLVDHINSMPFYADQNEHEINYGVLNGELHQPSSVELANSHAWAGLIGRNVGGVDEVNQRLLNYTPIFYHEDKIHTFKFLPRFYKVVDIEIRNEIVQRISPNEVRLTQLLCHTGIRQQHLVWLDKDKYDHSIDRYRKLQFAPLAVSSDKSHGEWTAIVSMHAIEIMDRQRKWYDSCTSQSYQNDLWYGLVEGSKFGRYKPLFRGTSESDTNWKNYRHFPVYMLILQHFIRIDLDDFSGSDLVSIKLADGSSQPYDDYSADFLSTIAVRDLTSPHTPHGLRAGFISDAVRFLPPSIIGKYMTGQTEALVWYYVIFDGENMPDHQELLADYMLKNMDRLERGDAPELADTVLKLHARLIKDIEKDAVEAIKTHGLISLTGVTEDQNGLELLRAKRYTKLAFNNCHICPFDNRCPKEVVAKIGPNNPCALCPYAIRGIDHLPAVSAEKDKAKEIMLGVLDKIQQFRALKPKARNPQILENLNVEYDHFAREAYALEAIEQQLYQMGQTGDGESFFLQEKDGLVAHFQRVELSEVGHVLKRLVDVQNFPDLSSPRLDAQFAQMRMRMLVSHGKYDELLKPSSKPQSHQLASQIASMMSAGALSVRDVMKIGQDSENASLVSAPTLSISASMGG
jgi:hypothetical protein